MTARVLRLVCQLSVILAGIGIGARELSVTDLGMEPRSFTAEPDASGSFTWQLPAGADALILPISGGILVEKTNESLMHWVRDGSPWDLSKLPIFGVRYGERTVVVIIPWPHYAELVVDQGIGVRFSFPKQRQHATPCEIVALLRGPDCLETARAFRTWRESAKDTGAIPRPLSLKQKAERLPAVARMFGAPHIYLWGPALFSRHDVARTNWIAFAKALLKAGGDTFAGKLVARFSAEDKKHLAELAESEWPADYLLLDVASTINNALSGMASSTSPHSWAEITRNNSKSFADGMRQYVHPPATWGDGLSAPMLEHLKAAGIDRAVLLLSDFYGNSARPDVAAKANELGFLLGPYDSYHSVHDPRAAPDETWETAQFDAVAYEKGRVLKADGSGHAGFRKKGYQFSPIAAAPYVRDRVQTALNQTPFSAWFMDCDATAECFDDYNPLHPATRVDDIKARRERLGWLALEKKLVVGSEEGSVLFADLIDFGHGIQTPYIGHLSPSFKDPKSPYFLGRYWPPATPDVYFKPIPVPPSLRTPYFDPGVRVPLYQAALGDEVVVTHHWNFDSFKFNDVAGTRELMELLYMVPPMYHLNRETWPQRRARIARHYAFWSPLHQTLATAPLSQFDYLTGDRLLQRTTFRAPVGDVTITVNFHDSEVKGYPAESATVAGKISVAQAVYRVH